MERCRIVVPCYNEADRLDCDAFIDYSNRNQAVDFVLVNDGSTDRTLDVLHELAHTCPDQFHVLDLPKNSGKAEAVRHGMLEAISDELAQTFGSADAVGYWDADLATPLETIDDFFQLLQNHPTLQLVTGARIKLLGSQIDRTLLRHYPGRLFATAASMTLRLSVYDTQCGAKLYRATPLVQRLFEEPMRTNWVFDVELLARMLSGAGVERRRLLESIVHEFPLAKWTDVHGSKVKATDFIRGLYELGRIYCHYFFRNQQPYICDDLILSCMNHSVESTNTPYTPGKAA